MCINLTVPHLSHASKSFTIWCGRYSVTSATLVPNCGEEEDVHRNVDEEEEREDKEEADDEHSE